jgi:hypothetical protein
LLFPFALLLLNSALLFLALSSRLLFPTLLLRYPFTLFLSFSFYLPLPFGFFCQLP